MKKIAKRLIVCILICFQLCSIAPFSAQAYLYDRKTTLAYIVQCIKYIDTCHKNSLDWMYPDQRPGWAGLRDGAIRELEQYLRDWVTHYMHQEGSAEMMAEALNAYANSTYVSQFISNSARENFVVCLFEDPTQFYSIYAPKGTAFTKLLKDMVSVLETKTETTFEQKTTFAKDVGSALTLLINDKRFPTKDVPYGGMVAQRGVAEIMGAVVSSYYASIHPAYTTEDMQAATSSFGRAIVTGDYVDFFIQTIRTIYNNVNPEIGNVASNAEKEVLLFKEAQKQAHAVTFHTTFNPAMQTNQTGIPDAEIIRAFYDCASIYEQRRDQIDNAKSIEELSDILQSFYVNIDPEPICLKKEGFTFHTEQVDAIVGNAPIVVMQDSVDVTNQFTIQTDEENRVTVTPKSNVSYDTPYNIYYDAADYKTAKRTIMYTQDESKIKDNNASLSDVTVLTESGTTSNITFDNYCAYVSDFSQIENTIFNGKNCVSSYDRFGNATLTVTAADGISSAIYKIYKTTSVKDASGNELYTFSVKPQSKYTLKIEFNNLQEQYANNMYIAVYDEDNHLQNIRTCQNAEYIEYTDDMTLKILNFGVQSMTPWANAYMLEAK